MLRRAQHEEFGGGLGVAERFLARLKERTALLRVGDPMDELTELGALISNAHAEKVMAYIASGQAEGATLSFGGLYAFVCDLLVPLWAKIIWCRVV
jgi:hypothetical protein